jgi:hypothetical protein
VHIGFDLHQRVMVATDVVDVTGRVVVLQPARARDAGSWDVTWDGRGAGGDRLPAGVYWRRMTAAGRVVAAETLLPD